MAPTVTDHNLLFGFLALQNDLVSRENLVAAVSVWLQDKSQTLSDILRDSNVLSPDEHQLLTALLRIHLARNNGDAERSLGTLSSLGSITNELRQLGNAELDATLDHVKSAESKESMQSAPTLAAGDSTSKGLRFRVVRPHARGGLGEVFVAEDTELNREVALKQIQLHEADNPASRARFLLEAEITGGLEHPGIVPVYGLGKYGDGRPFYAMRFIRGNSLKEAVDEFHRGDAKTISPHDRTLAFRKLLGRFIDVCEAIEYAHARGVLHRDLKPGNIMLGRYGETLVVDWGLAKPMGREDETKDSTETTLRPSSASGSQQTRMGSVIGTPAYMSPEQAAGRLDQLDTTADVYSLGATLYYVLTGRAPFAHEDDIGRLLNQVQAGKFPSPRELNPQLPKALEAICLKAMSLRSEDRYQKPEQLAEEIEKWLADEPISAYRERLMIRMLRWGRHHRALVAAISAGMLVAIFSLVAVLALATNYNRELSNKNRQLDKTNGRLAETNRNLSKARNMAETKRQQAEAVSKYLVETFRSPDPERDGRTIMIVEVLDRAARGLDDQLPENPLTTAALLNAIGLSYLGLGLHMQAIPPLENARSIQSKELGPEHPDTISSINNLAAAYHAAGRLDDALRLYEENLRLSKTIRGPRHRDTIEAMNNLGRLHTDAGRIHTALDLLEDAVELAKAELGPSQADTAATINNLAIAYFAAGRLNDSFSLSEKNLKTLETALGADHPRTLSAMHNLATIYAKVGKLPEAIELFEKALKLTKAKLGPAHPDTLASMNNLSSAFSTAGRFDEAIPLAEETVALAKTSLGPDHPHTLLAIVYASEGYRAVGRVPEAIALLEDSVQKMTVRLGADHPHTLQATNNLAGAYQTMARIDEAIPLFESGLELRKVKLGLDHPDTLLSMNNLGVAYQEHGQQDKSIPLLEEARKVSMSKLGPDHPYTLTSTVNLASAYRAAKRVDEAIPLFEEGLQLLKEKLGPQHPNTLLTMNNLAAAYLAANRLEQAKSLWEEHLQTLRALVGNNNPVLASSLASIGFEFLTHGDYETAEGYLRECLAIREKLLPGHWSMFNAKSMLGGALLGEKKYAEAEPLLLDGYQGLNEQKELIRDKSNLTNAIQRLVDLYTALDRADDAAKWRALLP